MQPIDKMNNNKKSNKIIPNLNLNDSDGDMEDMYSKGHTAGNDNDNDENYDDDDTDNELYGQPVKTPETPQLGPKKDIADV